MAVRNVEAGAKVATAITEKLPAGTTEPKVVRLDLADLASVAEVVRAWDGPLRVFEAQELELQTNTELTRQIHLLTTELHRRHVPQSASDSSALARATSDGDAPRAHGTTTLTSRPPQRY
jgi:hypothetical protein